MPEHWRTASNPPIEVPFPDIQDVIQWRPRPRITAEDIARHRAALARGEPSPLTPAQLDELNRRREIARRIRNSPTPEAVRNVGAVMTAIDDVQDGLVTAAVIARFVALRFAPRLIPYAGWLLLAGDVLNLFTGLSLLRLTRANGKRRFWDWTRINPFGAAARASRARALYRLLPNIPELLQVLQTTSALFGIGISLGPIVGFAQDLFFGGVEYVRRVIDQIPPLYRPLFNHLRTGPIFHSNGQIFTLEEHLQGLVASWYARLLVEELARTWPPSWEEQLAPIALEEITPPQPTDPATLYVLEDELGFPPDHVYGWPIPGITGSTVGEYANAAHPLIAQAHAEWTNLDAFRPFDLLSIPAGTRTHALINRVAPAPLVLGLIGSLTQDLASGDPIIPGADPTDTRPDPLTLLLMQLLERDFIVWDPAPRFGVTPLSLDSLLAGVLRLLAANPTGQISHLPLYQLQGLIPSQYHAPNGPWFVNILGPGVQPSFPATTP